MPMIKSGGSEKHATFSIPCEIRPYRILTTIAYYSCPWPRKPLNRPDHEAATAEVTSARKMAAPIMGQLMELPINFRFCASVMFGSRFRKWTNS